MSEMQEVPAQETDTRGEFLKFGAMALLLLGTVLVIWLLRPFIFNVVVPAVMGEGQPTAPMPLEAENQLPLKEPPAVDIEETSPAAAEGESEIFIPAMPIEGEEGDETTTTPEAEVEASGASEETAVIQHTVQPGENLTTIAQQYGVTVDDLIATNALTDPNHITAGTVLQIPSK
ncbi:MAG: LysM peptidoglycan-binding domain-containing protein [Chloroflexota bacterium]